MANSASPKNAITESARRYISKLDIASIQRDYPSSIDKSLSRICFSRLLNVDTAETRQTVTLVGQQADDFFSFVKEVVDTLSGVKDFAMQPERVTVDIIYEILAQFVFNTDNGRIDAKATFIEDLGKGLCGEPFSFRILVPIKNLKVSQFVRIDDIKISPLTDVSELEPLLKRIGRSDDSIKEVLEGRGMIDYAYAETTVDARSDEEAISKATRSATELFLLLRFCLVIGTGYLFHRGSNWSPYIDTEVLPTLIPRTSNQTIRTARLPGFTTKPELLVEIDKEVCELPVFKAGLLSRSISRESGKLYASDVYQAILWASRSHDETDSNTRLIFLVAALEAVIPAESKSEIVFRVAILSALLLKKSGRDPSETFEKVKRGYDLRSRLVHGLNVTVPQVVVDQLSHIVEDIIKLQLESNDVERLLRSKPEDYHRELQARLWAES